jgi:ParB family chromosome partitioning protein
MQQKVEKPRRLGRGLASLIGPITSQEPESRELIPIAAIDAKPRTGSQLQTGLQEIRIDAIRPNPYQVRTVWDEQGLADLAASIRSNGVIQPILVRKSSDGYQLIAGERRFRAAKLALLETIPAIVRQANDSEMLELALVENIHRTDLNPIERAKAYQSYITTFTLTQEETARRLGEDRSVIANYLRLLNLPDEIKQMLIDGQLTMGHARAILSLPTDELRRKLANRAMAGRLSVREVERLVRRYLRGSDQPTGVRVKPAHIVELENKLAGYLGTRVNIETRKSGQKGKITIEFYSLDEFDRIVERIGLTSIEEV